MPIAGLAPASPSDDMAVGDVAELVRDHALDLVGVVGGLDQARMDVDGLPAGDEGVDRVVVDQHDLDVARVEPGRLDERRRHVGEHRLGLGIAQDRLRGGGLRPEQGGGGKAARKRFMNARYRRFRAAGQVEEGGLNGG